MLGDGLDGSSGTGAAVQGSRGNLTRTISPPPATVPTPLVTVLKYDAKNNVVETVSPKGVNNGFSVTCSTNLSSAINPSGLFVTDFAYDSTPGTELPSVTRRYMDPDLGSQITAATKFEYGDFANPGMVTRVIPPRGNMGGSPDYSYATTLAYYASGSQAGMLQSVADPLGNQTRYAYDPVGRRTSLMDPLFSTWFFYYDNEDRVTASQAPHVTVQLANGTTTNHLNRERQLRV